MKIEIFGWGHIQSGHKPYFLDTAFSASALLLSVLSGILSCCHGVTFSCQNRVIVGPDDVCAHWLAVLWHHVLTALHGDLGYLSGSRSCKWIEFLPSAMTKSKTDNFLSSQSVKVAFYSITFLGVSLLAFLASAPALAVKPLKYQAPDGRKISAEVSYDAFQVVH